MEVADLVNWNILLCIILDISEDIWREILPTEPVKNL